MRLILVFVICVGLLACHSTLFAENAGLTLEGTISENLYLVNTRYYGQCPGYRKGTFKTYFKSETTPTASNLRVKVRNVTKGMDSDPYPYTNRRYDTGTFSEHTYIKADHRHRGLTFSVLNGLNTFRYTIYNDEDNYILEQGTFTTNIIIDEVYIRRNMYFKWVYVCRPTPYGTRCGWESVWFCPI